MLSRVLVPMDDSAMAQNALRYALENHPHADVTVFHVVGVPTIMMGDAVSLALEDDFEAAAMAHAEPVFDRAQAVAAEYDRDIETAFGVGHPARSILERAEEFDAIVMGSHGKHSEDITRAFLIGDVANAVFRRSPVPVTTVR
ncbi:MAG: universal stress protein [Halobacteriota archaeon]